jgi:probable phosphoglycerate mutase
LRRATQTAELLGLDQVIIEPALIEMSWGDWEGEILKPLRKQLGDKMRDNESRGLDFCPPGGESPRQVQARLQSWLQQIATAQQDSAAIVHKGIIRCIYALACNWDMRGESPVDFAWDAIHQFKLSANGKLLDHYQSIPLAKS